MFDANLLKLARDRVQAAVKNGFMDPASLMAGGAPPMDPAMMGGGAPPMDPAMMGGGAPPMDPAMMGGAPPMDPAAMGGGPPPDPMAMGGGAPPMPLPAAPEPAPAGGGGLTEDRVRQLITEAQGSGGGASGSSPKRGGKANIEGDIATMKKVLLAICNSFGITLPADAVLGDTAGGQPAPSGSGEATSGSSPESGGGGGTGPSKESEIKPIEPIPAAQKAGASQNAMSKAASGVAALWTRNR